MGRVKIRKVKIGNNYHRIFKMEILDIVEEMVLDQYGQVIEEYNDLDGYYYNIDIELFKGTYRLTIDFFIDGIFQKREIIDYFDERIQDILDKRDYTRRRGN